MFQVFWLQQQIVSNWTSPVVYSLLFTFIWVWGESRYMEEGRVRNTLEQREFLLSLNTVVSQSDPSAESTPEVIHPRFLQEQEEREVLISRHVSMIPPAMKDLELEEEVKESEWGRAKVLLSDKGRPLGQATRCSI